MSRRDRGGDPLLGRKVQIFFAGAALALIGIGVDSSLLVGLAIFILAAGMFIRFLSGKDPHSQEEGPMEEEDDVVLQERQEGP